MWLFIKLILPLSDKSNSVPFEFTHPCTHPYINFQVSKCFAFFWLLCVSSWSRGKYGANLHWCPTKLAVPINIRLKTHHDGETAVQERLNVYNLSICQPSLTYTYSWLTVFPRDSWTTIMAQFGWIDLLKPRPFNCGLAAFLKCIPMR